MIAHDELPTSSGDSAEGHSAPVRPGAANPAALTVAQLAKMLQLPEEKVRGHLAAGAPSSADGRINLVHYAAWLNKELARTDGD